MATQPTPEEAAHHAKAIYTALRSIRELQDEFPKDVWIVVPGVLDPLYLGGNGDTPTRPHSAFFSGAKGKQYHYHVYGLQGPAFWIFALAVGRALGDQNRDTVRAIYGDCPDKFKTSRVREVLRIS